MKKVVLTLLALVSEPLLIAGKPSATPTRSINQAAIATHKNNQTACAPLPHEKTTELPVSSLRKKVT